MFYLTHLMTSRDVTYISPSRTLQLDVQKLFVSWASHSNNDVMAWPKRKPYKKNIFEEHTRCTKCYLVLGKLAVEHLNLGYVALSRHPCHEQNYALGVPMQASTTQLCTQVPSLQSLKLPACG